MRDASNHCIVNSLALQQCLLLVFWPVVNQVRLQAPPLSPTRSDVGDYGEMTPCVYSSSAPCDTSVIRILRQSEIEWKQVY